jgi:hypothetical protein
VKYEGQIRRCLQSAKNKLIVWKERKKEKSRKGQVHKIKKDGLWFGFTFQLNGNEHFKN